MGARQAILLEVQKHMFHLLLYLLSPCVSVYFLEILLAKAQNKLSLSFRMLYRNLWKCIAAPMMVQKTHSMSLSKNQT